MVTLELYIITIIVMILLFVWQHKRIDNLTNLSKDALEYSAKTLKENDELHEKMKVLIDDIRNIPVHLENVQEYIKTLDEDIDVLYKTMDIKRYEDEKQ